MIVKLAAGGTVKLSVPQVNYLKKLDRDGVCDTGPATGNTAVALEKKGLAKTIAVYVDGHHNDYMYLLGFKYAITNEGRAALRAHEASR